MTSGKTRKALLAGVSALVFGAGGGVGYAQDIVREEIIVTASKRATSLQDTSLSVSAISGDQLQDLGFTSFDQILGTVPGVTLTEHGPGYAPVSFRGIVVNGNPDSGNPTTSTYLNDFPIGSNIRGPDIKLVDIERVEVLKGPQGTLYGQAAMGGVVRYITKKPEFDVVAGGVETTIESIADGNEGYWAQGYLNVPLTDNLAVRGVFYNYDRPGFIDNVLTGNKDINDEEITGGRTALRWQITDRMEFNTIYTRQDGPFGRASISAGGANSIASTYEPVPTGNPTTVLAPPDPDNPIIQSTVDPSDTADYEMLHVSLDVEFDGFDMTLMAADSSLDTAVSSNFGAFFRIYDDVSSINGDPGWVDDEFNIETYEARFTSSGDGPLEWIAGVWHEKNRFDRVFNATLSTPRPDGEVFLLGLPFFPLNDGEDYNDEDSFRTIEELAGYAELGYSFTDSAKLTLGYRRSNLKLDRGVTRGGSVFNGFNSPAIGEDNLTEENINSYKIHFEYRVNDDVLLHALASSGYRAGGVNNNIFGIAPVAPEERAFGTDTLWNYEVGARTSWLDDRLIVNGVAYYIDWSDIQLTFFNPNLGQSITQNAGEARIYGFDLETNLQVTDSLQVGLNYGFIDAQLTEDYFQVDPLVPVAAAGTRLPSSSKHSVTLFASYQQPMSDDLTLQADAFYSYRDSRAPALLTAAGTTGDALPSHDRANISVGLSHSSGVWGSVFIQNVFDTRDFQTIFNFAGGSSGSINRPRTIGLRLGYDF